MQVNILNISAEIFLEKFREEWEALKQCVNNDEQIIKAYESDSMWTAWMMGETRGKAPPEVAVPKQKGFLGKVGAALDFDSNTIRREDYTLDFSYVSGEPLLEKDHWGYASHLSVLIEHENDLDSIEFEMWKLLFWRAPLKIIITYDRPESERRNDGQRNRLTDKLKQLSSMLDKVNKASSEPDRAEYLIIIGDRKDDKSVPRWRWTTNFGNPQLL